jgi:hypothetical protein
MADIVNYVKQRDPECFTEKRKGAPSRLLDTASFELLESEMRRRVHGTDTNKKRFYCDVKKRRHEPHTTDEPVVTWEYVCDAIANRR